MILAMAGGWWGQLRAAAVHIYGLALTLGGPGLFCLALLDSSFLSFPEGNDILLVVLSIGQSWRQMAYYALMTTGGSVVGCLLLFLLGRQGGGFIQRRLTANRVGSVAGVYERWGLWSILVPSLLPPPTPFKVFVLWAGVSKVPTQKFVIAIVLGRSLRYFIWGTLAVLYGELFRRFVENNMSTVGITLLALLLAGILAYALGWFRGRRGADQEEVA